jgi:DNA polymerase-3 subunit epsilon
MTRGQNALVMEEESAELVTITDNEDIDISSFDLPIIRANEHELQGHEVVLADLDKAVNGQAFFRKIAG